MYSNSIKGLRVLCHKLLIAKHHQCTITFISSGFGRLTGGRVWPMGAFDRGEMTGASDRGTFERGGRAFDLDSLRRQTVGISHDLVRSAQILSISLINEHFILRTGLLKSPKRIFRTVCCRLIF